MLPAKRVFFLSREAGRPERPHNISAKISCAEIRRQREGITSSRGEVAAALGSRTMAGAAGARGWVVETSLRPSSRPSRGRLLLDAPAGALTPFSNEVRAEPDLVHLFQN